MENKKQQLKKLKNERGLTLVELLAVIVILGIIATIAFVMIGNVMDNAKKDAHIANAQQMIASAKLYEASGGNLDSGDSVTYKTLHDDGLIEKITDPWTKDIIEPNEDDKVEKKDGGYKVTLSGESSITATEEDLNKGDYDEIFD